MASFHTALGNTSTSFIVYLLSMISALGINAAVQDQISKHDAPWKRFAWAFGICIFAIIVISIIVVFTSKDSKNDTTRRLAGDKPVPNKEMGRL